MHLQCCVPSDAPVSVLRWLLFYTMEHTWIRRLYNPRVCKTGSMWYIGSSLLCFLRLFTRHHCGLCSLQLSLFLAFLLLVDSGVGPTFATVTQPRLLIRRLVVISSIQATQLWGEGGQSVSIGGGRESFAQLSNRGAKVSEDKEHHSETEGRFSVS